jgi:hypothetical protein
MKELEKLILQVGEKKAMGIEGNTRTRVGKRTKPPCYILFLLFIYFFVLQSLCMCVDNKTASGW